ncbi:MAG: type I-D CRISPR-associated helicase Cas3' [Anaerolineae bacterium]|nr:type I-D CRISPR-associated helicase Cas3' [Anaerolineae bacterium]
MWVNTLPVYSEVVEPAELPAAVAERLPADWRLSRHQLETYMALTSGDADVIINTAMTGDGKSLAAYLPVFTREAYHAFGMYPTIELSRDQARQLEGYAADLRRPVAYYALWGAELARFAEEHDFARRGDALNERFHNHEVILTNPDIFNLVMNYQYHSLIFTDYELPYSLCTHYDYLIFDEFHVFAMPQVVAALTAMLYIHEHSGGKHRFVFSSATPSEVLLEMLARSDLRCRVITGSYDHSPAGGGRLVLHPARLHFEPLSERAGAEDWLREHLGELVPFWRQGGRRARAAIIVNSVAAARRIALWLAHELEPEGISVAENTGLTDPERRRLSLEKDIVVGTSTIDVGIDFDINLLIFESTNAGSFLQRLGRLGRSRRNQPAFDDYRAYALISGRTPWVHERLVDAFAQQGLGDGAEVDRPVQLRQAAEAAFGSENDFLAYARRWGVLQAAHVVNTLEARRAQGAYGALATRLAQRYQRLLNLSDLTKARKRYWYLTARERVADGRPIIDEVIAFRGTSPFQVGCWDATVRPNALVTYDLLSLVQVASYQVMSEGEHEAALAERYSDEAERCRAAAPLQYVLKRRGDVPLVVRIDGFNRERENLRLEVDEELSARTEQVFVLRGLRIAEPRCPQLPALNEALRRQKVVSYATRRDARELRRMLRLPGHFPLYTARDVHGNREYTLAFGKAALMLEAQLIGWRKRDVEDEPIFV